MFGKKILTALVVGVLACGPALAQEKSEGLSLELKKIFERVIEKLNDSKEEVKEQARKALVGLGEKAVPLLEQEVKKEGCAPGIKAGIESVLDEINSDIREKACAAAIEKALDCLTKAQSKKGSWGTQYTVAVTSIVSLAFLAHDEDPFESKYADTLLKGYQYLMKSQKDGMFPRQGHTWIHGQGFATLFLAEFYGRILFTGEKPGIDTKELKSVVEKALGHIERCQSSTGGWWYTPDNPGGHSHEGSTTVCAVQALRAAANYGIEVNKKVLEKGFKYLEKSQNPDGGFRYKLSPGPSMRPGSAAALSTLVLMQKLDCQVLMKAIRYMKKIKPEGISSSRFPYYGHFYGVLAMKIISEEYGKYMPDAGKWYLKVQDELLKEQDASGGWKLKSWMARSEKSNDYATGFAALILSVPNGHLSIFHRDPPELPGEDKPVKKEEPPTPEQRKEA